MFKAMILTLTTFSLTSFALADEKTKVDAAVTTFGGEVNVGGSDSSRVNVATAGMNGAIQVASQTGALIGDGKGQIAFSVGSMTHPEQNPSAAVGLNLTAAMNGGFKMTNTLCAPYLGTGSKFEANAMNAIYTDTGVASGIDIAFRAKAGLACSKDNTVVIVTPQASFGTLNTFNPYTAVGGRALVMIHNRLVADLEFSKKSGIDQDFKENEFAGGIKYVLADSGNVLWVGADARIVDGRYLTKGATLTAPASYLERDDVIITGKIGVAF